MSIYNQLKAKPNIILPLKAFSRNLQFEFSMLQEKINKKEVDSSNKHLGAEIEFFLVDEKTLQPAMKNKEFLKAVHSEFLVPEVGKFDMEINTNHYEVKGKAFSLLEQHINKLWNACLVQSKKMGVIRVMIGTIPLSTYEQTKSCLSDIKRVKVIEKNLINASF